LRSHGNALFLLQFMASEMSGRIRLNVYANPSCGGTATANAAEIAE
jgi:hypothetical protein